MPTSMIEFEGFTGPQPARFRHYQGLSYAVQEQVAAQMTPGVTERDATRWAMKAYRREGAERYSHLPVALFGERSTLPDDPWTMHRYSRSTRCCRKETP